ncbi:MAG: hypothetical protein ACN6N0_14595 [Microvirgula sp.]
MNALMVSVPCLPGPAPAGPVVRAGELDRLVEVSVLLVEARQQAVAMVARAGREAAALREAARQDGVAAAQGEVAALRTAAVDDAVEWLVAQQELEIVLAGRLETRLRSLLAAELEALTGEQDSAGLLVQRLRKRLSTLPADDRVTVRVAAGQREAVGLALAGLDHVDIVADAGLATGQAILDTPFVRVTLDIDAHLQTVLARLRHGDRERP